MGEREEYRMVSAKEGSDPSGPNFTSSSTRRVYIVVGVVCLLVLVAVAIALGVYFGVTGDKELKDTGGPTPTPLPVKADSSFEIHLSLDSEYNGDFDDPATAAYQTLKDKIENLIDTVIDASTLREWYIRNMVTGFRYGSTVAIDKVDFKTRVGLTIVTEEVLMEVKKGLREQTAEVDALDVLVDDTTVTETPRTGIVYLGESCSEDNDCSDRNSLCASSSSQSPSVCSCPEDYYDSNFQNTTRGRCGKLLSYGEVPCWSSRECRTPRAICSYHQCICDPSTHLLKDGACEPLSAQPAFCPRSIPNEHAILGPDCINDHSKISCRVRCNTGYQLYSQRAQLYGVYIYCLNGTWATSRWERERGFGISNICLPEADFRLCGLTIPNGKLEESCGPETDWLCDFKCNDGFWKHKFMSGKLKNMPDRSSAYKLYCDQGVWKTGYEDAGLDVTGVCLPMGTLGRNCTQQIPNGNVTLPCPSGYYCLPFQCNPGHHLHVLAKADKYPFCVDGVWKFKASKLDKTITPNNVCIPDNRTSVCAAEITHGHILDSACTRDCKPECDEGFYFPEGPGRLTCENGTWLTKDYPYTGDNICFPNGGYLCPHEIPNGTAGNPNSYLNDQGGIGRYYVPYQCNDGYRKHREIDQLECLAGTWVTGHERLGISVDDVCTPFNPS